jgi:citrate synthase
MSQTVEIKIGDKAVSYPVIVGTEDEKAIDISKLLQDTGHVTFDLGYKNTGVTKSAITFLDGDKGILHYRGYSIEDLASKSTFTEVCYLVLHGELPTKTQLDEFEQELKNNYELPAEVTTVLASLPSNMHPMGMLSVMFATLTGAYPNDLEPNAPESTHTKNVYRLLGHMPAMVAAIYRKQQGESPAAADKEADYCSAFLQMMTGNADKTIVEALNTLLILHADHEQNCSTSTVRMIGSSNCNLFASVSGGNCALWGPLHGGANQEVLEMLEDIKNDGGDVAKYVGLAKDKTSNFRLMGFGHRVYKNFDPRARVIKKYCDEVLAKLNVADPVLEIAKGLESAALSDSYFVDRKLFPNVDFYSGIIYRALGIPVDMFTVMFAFGRLPGWIAQWKELRTNKEPIGRPRQVYVGKTDRAYVSIENR